MRRQLLVNGALLALALGTLGVVWATREAPTTTELTSRKGKLLPSFDKAAVTRLRFTRDAREVVLEPTPNAPGEFRIVEPWRERADIATVNRLLGALDLASSLRPAEGVSSEAAGLGGAALRIRVESGENAQIITLGGPAPAPRGARYVEVSLEGQSARYVVTEGVASELSVELDQFREPLLLEYGRSELHRIHIENSGSVIDLEQHERGEFLFATSSGSELANRDTIDRLVTALSRLSADRFLTTPHRAVQRALRVEVEPTDSKQPKVSLTFGDDCPDDKARVQLLREQPGKAPRLGCVPADVMAPLSLEPTQLRLTTLFAARTDEVEELRVKRAGQQYVLLRKDSGFRLRTPREQEITLDSGNERIRGILQAEGERANASSRAALGLDGATGELFVQVTASTDASRREERVLVGAPRADGSVCLERALDKVVLCFPATTAKLFEPDATLLRPLSVLSFAPSELQTLTTISKDLRQSVTRQGDGTYRLLEPAGYSHDGSAVSDAVQTLGTLGALRWVALGDEPRFELAPPRLTVRLTFTAEAPPRELSVGAATDAGYYARLSPDPAVFLLSRAAFDDISLPLVDRALSPFGSDYQSATLKSKHGQSDVTGTRVDNPSYEGALSATLGSLKASRALHLGKAAASEGFAAPRLQITYRKGPKEVALLVGRCETGDDAPFCYARRADVDATFALPESIVTDLLAATSHEH